MSENVNTARSLAAGVLRMVAVIGLLSVVLGACIYVVSGELASTAPTVEFGDVYDGSTGTVETPHEAGEPPARTDRAEKGVGGTTPDGGAVGAG
ncbi:hypothetical protein [Natronomonas marina]|jgi:hypothetical protein|uniref:hypothetical protein n=1 Tax=Natronomonas marina TaxID=2961939 RepID=UPI0020CA247B|nr:hypothetical protein [Natronomonas marina]